MEMFMVDGLSVNSSMRTCVPAGEDAELGWQIPQSILNSACSEHEDARRQAGGRSKTFLTAEARD